MKIIVISLVDSATKVTLYTVSGSVEYCRKATLEKKQALEPFFNELEVIIFGDRRSYQQACENS